MCLHVNPVAVTGRKQTIVNAIFKDSGFHNCNIIREKNPYIAAISTVGTVSGRVFVALPLLKVRYLENQLCQLAAVTRLPPLQADARAS